MSEPRSARPGTLRLLIPSGWVTLSTAAGEREKQIKRVIDRQFRGQPRDELIQQRILIDRSLRQDLSRAAERGATQVHALVDPIDGLPISATLVVAQLLLGPESDLDAELAALLGSAEGVTEVDRLDLNGFSASRRRRRAQERVDADPDSPLFWHTHVDYLVQASDDTIMVLSFVTSTDPLADAVVVVFDAIAATLHVAGEDEIDWDLSVSTS